jgi:multicomponent Na+:H+ antiporter subunit D
MGIIWLTLLFGSAGVFLCSGIKIVFFTFFSRNAGHRVQEAPPSMLIAMGITAFICLFLGVYPKFFYSILPYPVDFAPYTLPHVLSQLQLLLFSALAFTLLLRSGIYPAEIKAINLDTDLIYRKGGRLFYQIMDKGLNAINKTAELDAADKKTISENLLKRAQSGFYPIGIMGLFVAIYFSLLFLL